MNNNVYPGYPNNTNLNLGATQPPITNLIQPSNKIYAESLLVKNVGRLATFYMSYADSIQWKDKIFTGVIEDAGRDFVVLSDPNTGKWTILWILYLDYVEFDAPIKLN